MSIGFSLSIEAGLNRRRSLRRRRRAMRDRDCLSFCSDGRTVGFTVRYTPRLLRDQACPLLLPPLPSPPSTPRPPPSPLRPLCRAERAGGSAALPKLNVAPIAPSFTLRPTAGHSQRPRRDGRRIGSAYGGSDGRSQCSLRGKQWPLPTASAAVAVAERD